MLNLFGNNKDQQENKQPNGNPVWLRWTVLIFMAYAAYTVYKKDPTTFQVTPPINETIQPQQTGQAEPLNSSLKQTAATNNTEPSAPLRVAETTISTTYPISGEIQGRGDRAACGQTATIVAEASLPDGSPVPNFSLPSEKTQVTIGAATTGWQHGILGMSAGGVREFYVPVAKVLDAKTIKQHTIPDDSAIRFKVTLDALEPNSPKGALGFQATELLSGIGSLAECGDNVSVHVDIWGNDGMRLYSTKSGNTSTPVSFEIGKVPYFYGLDRAVLSQRQGGVRRVIVPPQYLKAPANSPAPSDEIAKSLIEAAKKDTTLIMDVYLISVEKMKK